MRLSTSNRPGLYRWCHTLGLPLMGYFGFRTSWVNRRVHASFLRIQMIISETIDNPRQTFYANICISLENHGYPCGYRCKYTTTDSSTQVCWTDFQPNTQECVHACLYRYWRYFNLKYTALRVIWEPTTFHPNLSLPKAIWRTPPLLKIPSTKPFPL